MEIFIVILEYIVIFALYACAFYVFYWLYNDFKNTFDVRCANFAAVVVAIIIILMILARILN